MEKQQKNRSRNELRAASNLLSYEIDMFRFASEEILSKRHAGSRLQNALIESFVTHLRILYDFFLREPREDDISASHFLAGSPAALAELRKLDSTVLKVARKRADKELAHLTYTRVGKTREDKQWPCEQVVAEIDCIVDIFLNNVPCDCLGDRWDLRKA